ncbi:MAG: ATP-binding protein [Coriobacteriaceae bacterium]
MWGRQIRGQLKRRMRFYLHLSLLIADELRYLQTDNGGAGLIFQIVSISYKRGSTARR